MSRKVRIILDVECTAPKEFFIEYWSDIPEEFQNMLERDGPIPCCGSGEITELCVDCQWAIYDWDSEPI